ncbi:hypothetical protein BDM02DRAFT_3183436 [Thelephora ganbajun]|uniref:Uncharacterized protein n=1 Tax=Thelephora ganbajun TaxID=370292 RepID=A0ACB6ZTK1_THEGA|nr:hypothetical protein BDM02DRAFT_3183436 [Thelephora ganbajun]
MAGHLLFALSSLAVYFHVAYSVITAQQMLGAVFQFSSDFTWPRINEVAAKINYTGFTPDGRVDVTNSYEGRELNTEYIFGLFSSVGNSNTTRLLGVPGNTTLTELAINPPVISFSSLRNFDWGPVTIPIQIDVWFLFDNESGLIAQYDITFRRLAWAIDYLKPFLKPQLVKELGSMADKCKDIDDLMHLRAAIDVCREHEVYCHGALQQYESTQVCIDYIYHKTPLGKIYEWGGDTAMCRYIHKGMIKYRPTIHCPHIGRGNVYQAQLYHRNNPKAVPSPILAIGSELDTSDTPSPLSFAFYFLKLEASDISLYDFSRIFL